MLTFTDVQKNSFRKEVNNVFLTRLLDKAKVIVDPAFYEGMNYERALRLLIRTLVVLLKLNETSGRC